MLPLIVAILLSANIHGQSISGDWYGLIDVQGMQLSFNLHIVQNDDGLTGTFDVSEQGAINVPLSSVSLNKLEFQFSFVPAGISYSGITDAGFNNIMGYFKQGQTNTMLKFGRDPVDLPENNANRIKEIYKKEEAYIEMRDGVKLLEIPQCFFSEHPITQSLVGKKLLTFL